MGNEFIKTNHIGIAIGVFENIPVSAKKSSVTSTICHNDGFMRGKTGGKRTYMGRVHIDVNSAVCWGTGCHDGHAKKMGSITSGLVTSQQASDFPEGLLIITGCIGVFESISVLDGFSGGRISMVGLADSTILLGDDVGQCRSGVAIRCFQDLCMFMDETVVGFLGQ